MTDELHRISVELLPGQPCPNSTIFVLGGTGSGKTTLMANLIRERPRFILVDTKNDFPPEFFGSACVVVKDLNDLIANLNVGKTKIIYKLEVADEKQRDEIMSQICMTAWQMQERNPGLPPLTVACDEFNAFVGPSSCPYGLQEIIQRGRSVKIEKIFGAQWFNHCPAFARDSFSEIYVYAHYEEIGLNKLAGFGFDPNEVKQLPQFTCLHKKGASKIETVEIKATKPKK